ncbi:MAG: Asp23/Gls24 family envelope stress response protein [Eubacterium sp.]|nr:Asp23/Gls24 family envelope stress response protein [Eubacterium sp.]
MKGKVQSDFGEIMINPDVIVTYAGSVAVECFGIVGMAAVNIKDGLVRILKKDSLKHGINVRIEANDIYLDFHVIIAYGLNIATVAENLIEHVKYNLEAYTGMKVKGVRVIVEGVRTID